MKLQITKARPVGALGTVFNLTVNDVNLVVEDDGQSGEPMVFSTDKGIATPTATTLFNHAIEVIYAGSYWDFLDDALIYLK